MKNKTNILLLFFVCLCLPTVSIRAQEETKIDTQDESELHAKKLTTELELLPQGDPKPVTLQQAVTLALKNNLTLKIAELQRRSARTRWRQEKAAFDPELFATGRYFELDAPSTTPFIGASVLESDGYAWESGVRSTIRSGGWYSFSLANDNVRSNSVFVLPNPTDTTDLVLSFRQPLLRGFGKRYNTRRIQQTKNLRSSAAFALSRTQADVVLDTVRAYWELVYSENLLQVHLRSLEAAAELLRINQEKFNIGQIAEVEVVKAEAGQTAREEAVLLAQADLEFRRDALRLLITPSDNLQDWLGFPQPTEPLQIQTQPLYLSQLVQTAWENRSDLRELELAVENSNVDVASARNERLPQLDLFAEIRRTGLTGNFGNSLDEVGSGKAQSPVVGVELSFPLGNRRARNRLRETKHIQDQAELQLLQLRQQVLMEVRQATRLLLTADKRLDVTAKALTAARRQLEQEMERFQVGRSTTFQILEFQDDVAAAEANELRAKIDHQLATLSLDRVQETLLKQFQAGDN